VGRTLNRVAGIVSAGALITFAAAPAALAQETDTTAPSTTETTTSETTTTTTAPSTSETTTAPTTAETTTGTTSAPGTTDVTKTTKPETTTTTSATTTPPDDNFPDNTGHGFVGLGGEGVLVINCAAGHVGNVATQYLDVTGGPDQDESDGRIWNYTVRVVDLPAGTTTGKFSWTCDGVEGEGTVDFEQEQPPTSTSSTPTSTSAPSSTAPVTTATSAAPGNAAPKAQVKVAPKGGIETGFGGMAW
jgi:hypothetical protein